MFPRAVQLRARPRVWLVLATVLAVAACAPTLRVGEWTCSENGEDASIPDSSDPVAMPWSTGFENRFCDYTQLGGFCYAESDASYEIVSSPVHSGRFAAAFRITSGDMSSYQTRCVRQGVLPTAAYYGVWYFVPVLAKNSALWNLLHFQGGDTSRAHGLWDVSLVTRADGELEAVVFDFLNGRTHRAVNSRPIPIGEWFHFEFYLERAADRTGEVALYQDGELLIEVKNTLTDDSEWGQWYVGNLATGLTPADSTLYVDDVTIRETR